MADCHDEQLRNSMMPENVYLSRAREHFHRSVWQRIPKSVRREFLFRLSAMAAPKLAPSTLADEPVIVVGTLRSSTGLGQSARLCYDALASSGVRVGGIDVSRPLMQPENLPEFEFKDARGLEGPGTLIVHTSAPLMPLILSQLGRRVIDRKRVIGYWAWELPAAPRDWQIGVPFTHEIWVPSAFTASAIEPIAGGRPVRVVHHPVNDNAVATLPCCREGSRPFTVLSMFDMGSSFTRKNPCASIEAFKRAFGDDPGVRLILKVSNSSAYSPGMAAIQSAVGGVPNIEVIAGALSRAELNALFARSHVLLSLHRAEGFGLTIAEAMLRGMPAVATNWSGNCDFLNYENGMPVGYEMVPAHDPQHTYDFPEMQWADANIDDAASALVALRTDKMLWLRLSHRAAEDARSMFDKSAYCRNVMGALGLGMGSRKVTRQVDNPGVLASLQAKLS